MIHFLAENLTLDFLLQVKIRESKTVKYIIFRDWQIMVMVVSAGKDTLAVCPPYLQ